MWFSKKVKVKKSHPCFAIKTGNSKEKSQFFFYWYICHFNALESILIGWERTHLFGYIKSRPFLLLVSITCFCRFSLKDCSLCILCTIPQHMLGNTLFLHPPEEKFLSDITKCYVLIYEWEFYSRYAHDNHSYPSITLVFKTPTTCFSHHWQTTTVTTKFSVF